MTDFHPDLNYTVGANAKCNLLEQLICCRPDTGLPADPADGARPTGEYGCDIPFPVIEQMGDYINKNLKANLDAVVWTGDATIHTIWEDYLNTAERYTRRLGQFFDDYFTDLKLYPISGNHDNTRPNSQRWSPVEPMLEVSVQAWKHFLDEDEQA